MTEYTLFDVNQCYSAVYSVRENHLFACHKISTFIYNLYRVQWLMNSYNQMGVIYYLIPSWNAHSISLMLRVEVGGVPFHITSGL